MEKDGNNRANRDDDRLSILEKIERGEISIEEAEAELAQALESETPTAQVEATETDQVEAIEPMEIEKPEDTDIPTRRERKLALAEKFQNWNPQMMVGSEDSWQWPWADKNWQWMWQNFGYPVYVRHSIDVTEESELKVVLHQGDLFISGWNESALMINGAAFDIRTGQDENVIRAASSTGQLQIWLPDSITRVEARVTPGDVWLRNISADIDAYCQSGDLGCERIKGKVRVQVNGGDARLMGIEGPIDAGVTRGNTDVRDISSAHVSLKSSEGDIWLNLNSVSSGEFRCESVGGDINLLTNGELACELLAEASEGGRISPVILPWQKLLERSESKLHGILMGGGASISLIARGGKIYIQEPWMNIFSAPQPG
ncbi:hypothetical protein ACFL6S_18545 [Candidatus Poribacteria bacterium]